MKPQLLRHLILFSRVIGLCVLSGAWFGIHAEPQQDKLAQKFIGVWQVVSVEGIGPMFDLAWPGRWMKVFRLIPTGHREPLSLAGENGFRYFLKHSMSCAIWSNRR
jgi:hypothetical protein